MSIKAKELKIGDKFIVTEPSGKKYKIIIGAVPTGSKVANVLSGPDEITKIKTVFGISNKWLKRVQLEKII